MDPMAFGTSWKSIVEDAGWGAAALLTVLALVALLVFAVKGRYRSSQARAARALLGARNDQTPVGSCASTASDLSSVTQIQPALAFSPKVPCVIRVMSHLPDICRGMLLAFCLGRFICGSSSEC